jgi:hypothetical protein
LLAIACRRGDIAGTDVGAIRIERTFSIVNVASEVADAFEKNSAERDARDPGVRFRRDTGNAAAQDPQPSGNGQAHAPARAPQRNAPHTQRPEAPRPERPRRFDKGARKPPGKWGKWAGKPEHASTAAASPAATAASNASKGGDKPLARRHPKKA